MEVSVPAVNRKITELDWATECYRTGYRVVKNGFVVLVRRNYRMLGEQFFLLAQ